MSRGQGEWRGRNRGADDALCSQFTQMPHLVPPGRVSRTPCLSPGGLLRGWDI